MTKISIITSMKTGSDQLKNLWENIQAQAAFDYCEWIIIDADSRDEDAKTLGRGLHGDFWPNVRFFELDSDPGLYSVWNQAIEKSKSPYITNMNMDDRRAPWALEELAFYLDQNESVDVIYGECLETSKPNESFFKNSATTKFPCLPATLENMLKANSPHAAPMWRKSLHERYGYFNEEYKICGDYEMWMRALRKGAKFKAINSELCLYYRNPDGLSTKKNNIPLAQQEIKKIRDIDPISKPRVIFK